MGSFLVRKYTYAWIFAADNICSDFKEQIMSQDKYPSIILAPKGNHCVYYSLTVFVTRAVLTIGKYHILRPIARERKYFQLMN